MMQPRRVSAGEKRATEWSADQLPAWVPDGLAALLRSLPKDNATAAELDVGGLSAADALVDFCSAELRPDLLLVGSRPRGMLSRVFTSSVSAYVVRFAFLSRWRGGLLRSNLARRWSTRPCRRSWCAAPCWRRRPSPPRRSR